MKIYAMKNGNIVDYIKSIAEDECTFEMTEKEQAKEYENVDIVHDEIDTLTRINSEYIYLYE